MTPPLITREDIERAVDDASLYGDTHRFGQSLLRRLRDQLRSGDLLLVRREDAVDAVRVAASIDANDMRYRQAITAGDSVLADVYQRERRKATNEARQLLRPRRRSGSHP